MRIIVYDYTETKGNIIMEDDDYYKGDAQFWTVDTLVTIEGSTYEIFEVKIEAYLTLMEIAVRLH